MPYVALEMLTSAAQDRVFYRVDGPEGFITGYQTLPVVPRTRRRDRLCRQRSSAAMRSACGSLQRAASSGVSAIPFTVTVAETTIARSQLAQSLLVQASVRLAVLILAAAVIVWFAVSALARRRSTGCANAIALRSQDDLSPIRQDVPREVRGAGRDDQFVHDAAGLGARGAAALHRQCQPPAAHADGDRPHAAGAGAARRRATTERRAAIAAADTAVAHAERMLAQLLLLARIDEAASDRLKFETIDLAALARSQTAEHVPRASAAGIDLGYEGEESRDDARRCDAAGRDCCGNLIDNAIAYAGHGAEATVAVEAAAPGLRLSVADSGPGVAASKLPELRQRFGRGGTDKPGAGLGLAIVEEIAGLFGGTTSVASDAGQGFRVTISLPVS